MSLRSLAKSKYDERYLWAESSPGSGVITRTLSNSERMFVILNQVLRGQSSPFGGATISLQQGNGDESNPLMTLSELHERGIEACAQLRWKFPTVAARILYGDTAAYALESADEVRAWASRSVFTMSREGGWVSLFKALSGEMPTPSVDGDSCRFYLISRPEEIAAGQLRTFDILLRCHHAYVDAAGARSILNEFISRLAAPLPSEEITWGKEVDRLLPPVVLLLPEEGSQVGDEAPVDGLRMNGIPKPDIGLPIYRPNIKVPESEDRGTQLVTHTWDPEFLSKLLNTGRRHGVKLTAVLHAALLKAVYDSRDTVPEAGQTFKSGSFINLRQGHMIPPYSGNDRYVNYAVAIHPIEVPCELLEWKLVDESFWEAATFIRNRWEVINGIKAMGQQVEKGATKFINTWDTDKAAATAAITRVRTCPYYSSDPPGSDLLKPSYPVSGHTNLLFVLESYQLGTEQGGYLVSARSHSWNGKLTLCLIFNSVRNPREEMQKVLDRWVQVVEQACESQ